MQEAFIMASPCTAPVSTNNNSIWSPTSSRAPNVSLEFYGIFHDFSGYAVHSCAIARFLIKQGFNLKLIPYNYNYQLKFQDLDLCRYTKIDRTYPIIRLVCLPPHPVYQKNRYTILLTMMETQSLHPGVISCLRTADEVWTPSVYNFSQFKEALPKNFPVHFMPEGTDINLYNNQGNRLDIRADSIFVAVSVFHWQWRKGPDILIRAWLKAFTKKDRARLVLLTRVPTLSRREGHAIIQQEIEKARFEINNPDPAEIIIADDYLPDEAMPAFYRAADCFVLPTRGEGWCLPALDAMACGTPVIITGASGQLAFCNENNSLLLKPGKPATFVPDKVRLMNFFDNQKFNNPSVDDCAAALRILYTDQNLKNRLANQAMADVRRLWHWDNSLKPIARRLLEIDAMLKEKRNAHQ